MEFLFSFFSIDIQETAPLAGIVILLVAALKGRVPATIFGKNSSALIGLVLSFVLGAAQHLAPFTGLAPMDVLAALFAGATVWIIATGSYDLVNGFAKTTSSAMANVATGYGELTDSLDGVLDKDFPDNVPG